MYTIPDQYMFGPAFMVSPVTAQLYTGAKASTLDKSRKVYLPKSTIWFNFWTGGKFTGGITVNFSVPLDKLPLYVKAGSIIPMGPVMEYATEKVAKTIELRIYPGADEQFKYYEDENDNYNYEKGKYATILFSWADKQKQLTISDTKGSFSGMLKSRTFNIVLVQTGKAIGEQETIKVDKIIKFTGKRVQAAFP